MSEPAVLVECIDHTMVITLNRPEARNAVNLELTELVGTAVEEAEQDPHVRVIVLTGSGDKAFCAGADLKAVSRGERLSPEGKEHWGFAGWVRHHTSKPTICAVNAAALGGGTELVLASDLAVAVESATFGLPEVKRGIIAGAGGAFRIMNAVGRKRALHVLLTGEPIDAATALDWGLINEVVPDGTALEHALNLAQRIASNAPLSVQASKRIAYAVVDGQPAGEDELWNLTSREGKIALRSHDATEGARAFVEKRAPVWQGR